MNVLSNRPLFICNGAKNIVTLKTMNLRSFFASHAYAQVFHHCSVSCHIKFSGVRVHWECLARLSSHGFAVPLLLIVMCCAVLCGEYSIIIICCWPPRVSAPICPLTTALLPHGYSPLHCTTCCYLCSTVYRLSIYISLYFKSNRLSIEKTITIHRKSIAMDDRNCRYNVCDMF